jgi:hypothetical protein
MAIKASEPPTQLDHFVILVPYKYLADPPAWLKDNFTISPGGRHADGKTENRLILFQDGTYLEIIAFIDDDPEKRKGHWWDKPYGIVDFALTTKDDFDYAGLLRHLKDSGSGISYAEPKAGGRLRPDGVELKWKVTFPLGAERGEVPFWCHDVTPRERRVPGDKSNTAHPSKVVGVTGVTVSVSSSKAEKIRQALRAITERSANNDGKFSAGHPLSPSVSFESWIRVAELEDSGSEQRSQLHLSLAAAGDKTPSTIEQVVGDDTLIISFEARG